MNPYLEHSSVWHDFHERFIPLAADILGSQVLPRYFVKIDEHLYVHDLTEESGSLAGRADVAISEQPLQTRSSNPATGLLIAPAEVTTPQIDIESASYLEIVDRASRQVVTVLELLSPANKLAGKDRDQYVSKAKQLMWTNVNFVEIDQLRCGLRSHWMGMPSCDYSVVVSRAEQSPKAGLWPIQLRDRLPVIPVPLRPGDADAQLDLQQLLHRIYDSAGYGYYIYDNAIEPPLSPEDAEWVKSLIP
jgi:hypothetical protein